MIAEIESAWPTVKDVALFLLALYGASLSTFNLMQSIRKERRTLSVKLSTALPSYQDGQTGKPIAVVEAVNVGLRPVTVTIIAIQLDDGARLFNMAQEATLPGLRSTPLPETLNDGASAVFFTSYEDIGHALNDSGRSGKQRLTPIAVDSTGGIHRGTSWQISSSELLM